jgi:hypothetical protein
MARVRHLGYTRVSTSGQDAKLQLDALVDAGVQKRDVFADVTSGSKAAIERPGMKKLLAYVEPGDTVVVWRVASDPDIRPVGSLHPSQRWRKEAICRYTGGLLISCKLSGHGCDWPSPEEGGLIRESRPPCWWSCL